MEDKNKIRELCRFYAEAANSDFSVSTIESYKKINDLQIIKPPVLVFEIPWGEFNNCEELRLQCSDPRYHGIEWFLRSSLYQWKYFRGNHALHPYFRVGAAVSNTGIGISSNEKHIAPEGGSYAVAHGYTDVLSDESVFEKLHLPEINYDKTLTDSWCDFYSDLIGGIIPVKKSGIGLYFASWDTISILRGVENALYDLYDRPEYMHRIIDFLTRVHERELDRYEELNVLETDQMYVHCTPAPTYELPAKDLDRDRITAKDVWCRAMAQMLAVVSPQMQDEFDLQYTKRLFDRCGLSYYGCCEPLDSKIETLRQFKNLRRISITPWANPDIAAEKIQGDYVFSYKSNPAYVGMKKFDPAPVIEETERVVKACIKNNTPCEFIVKDISTVCGNPNNLTLWAQTVQNVIDNYY